MIWRNPVNLYALNNTPEYMGSYASNLIIDTQHFTGVGLEVNATHLRPVSPGEVGAVCSPIHVGRKTHFGDIKS